MAEEQEERYLAWDACYNARDVGGYPTEDGRRTRNGALVRSDDLYRLTSMGQAALREYGIRTIIDLRLAHELQRDPNPFAGQQGVDDVPRYLNLPLHDVASNAAIEEAEPTHGEYIVILDRNKKLVGAAIKAVAASLADGGVLVHCHGGKDRTGIVTALLLSLAGVPREIIAEDYALSEVLLEPSFSAWVKERSRAGGQHVERPLWMFSPPEKMLGLLEHLDREYGGVEGYLEAVGVTQEEMAAIRTHLIAPADDPTG